MENNPPLPLGYDRATVRAIADLADVDAAMVNHWFDGKDGLFPAALQSPLDPQRILPGLLDGDPEQLSARLVRTFLTAWDTTSGGAMAALIRSIASHDKAAVMMREFVSRVILDPVSPPPRCGRSSRDASLNPVPRRSGPT
jgi:AcrR family transcriptional regulator